MLLQQQQQHRQQRMSMSKGSCYPSRLGIVFTLCLLVLFYQITRVPSLGQVESPQQLADINKPQTTRPLDRAPHHYQEHSKPANVDEVDAQSLLYNVPSKLPSRDQLHAIRDSSFPPMTHGRTVVESLPENSIYSLPVKFLNGTAATLEFVRGKVALVVNVASA